MQFGYSLIYSQTIGANEYKNIFRKNRILTNAAYDQKWFYCHIWYDVGVTFKNEKVLPVTQQFIGAIFEVIGIWRCYTGVQEKKQTAVMPV